MDEPVLIGQLAELSGVTIAAVRVYERRGLIAPLYRAPNGYRYYDASLQQPIRVFGAAMSLGISLSEVGEIFVSALPLQREPTPEQARDTAVIALQVHQRHIEAIDAELARLEKLRVLFARRVDYCAEQIAGPGPARIGVPTTTQRRRNRPGRMEYVRAL